MTEGAAQALAAQGRPCDDGLLVVEAKAEEGATHSSVLAWRIPGAVEPGGLPSMGSHRVGHATVGILGLIKAVGNLGLQAYWLEQDGPSPGNSSAQREHKACWEPRPLPPQRASSGIRRHRPGDSSLPSPLLTKKSNDSYPCSPTINISPPAKAATLLLFLHFHDAHCGFSLRPLSPAC